MSSEEKKKAEKSHVIMNGWYFGGVKCKTRKKSYTNKTSCRKYALKFITCIFILNTHTCIDACRETKSSE